jgi:site-specific DNA-cytosine methylase
VVLTPTGETRLTSDDAATLQSYPTRHLKLQKLANASVRSSDQPAQTMAFGHDAASAGWFDAREGADGHVPFAGTKPDDRLSEDEAAALQSYPPIEWRGAKTKVYLQIGNAVPPLLARHVLEALWAPAPAVAEVVELRQPAIERAAA